MNPKFLAFYNLWNGKYCDYDGAFGYQCVDLYKQWVSYMGYKPVTCSPSGFARSLWEARKTNGILEFCDEVTGEMQSGDIVVWAAAGETPLSHVALYWGAASGNKAEFFSQNPNPCEICTITLNNVLGALRLKNMEVKTMDFKNGYQTVSWNDQLCHVYKQSGNEKLGLIAKDYGEVDDIKQFSIEGKTVNCLVNCHYFNNHPSEATYGEYYGRAQGFNCNGTTDKPSEGDKPYMDLVVLNDGTVKCGDFNSWDYTKEYVQIGAAPAWVGMNDGKETDFYSPACGYGKVTTANTQTLLLKCKDGTFALATVEGDLNLKQCRQMAQAYGCTEISAYDSGGSSQMVVNGKCKLYTGRKIPTCLCFYVDEGVEPVEPEPTKDAEATLKEIYGILNEYYGGK